MEMFSHFSLISKQYNCLLDLFLPASLHSLFLSRVVKELDGEKKPRAKRRVGAMPAKQRERESEKRGGRVKNVVAAEVPGEPGDAK